MSSHKTREASEMELERRQKDNPCFEESMMSQRCLSSNNYKKDNCESFFENYRQCQRFWNKVRQQRFFEGKRPLLPPAAERQQIKSKVFGSRWIAAFKSGASAWHVRRISVLFFFVDIYFLFVVMWGFVVLCGNSGEGHIVGSTVRTCLGRILLL